VLSLPQTLQLEFVEATLEPSTRWPVFCRHYDSGSDAPEAPGYGDLGYKIYKVTFNIPGDVPEGLYELRVSVEADGFTMARTTHHSVKVVDEFKDDYWIAAIADPHFNDGRGEDQTYAGDPEVVEYRTFKKAVDIINHLDVESTGNVRIVTERPIYFNYQGYTQLNWPGGQNVIGL